MIRMILLILAFPMGSAFAAGKASTTPDAQAVDAACKTDAATAGCGGEKVGTGLMKCIHAYKMAHKDFKVSKDCKTAMKKEHMDHKAKTAH